MPSEGNTPHTPTDSAASMLTRDALFSLLDELGIATSTFEHPATPTVPELKEHCSHLRGALCKHLFLKGKKNKQLYLIIAHVNTEINLKKLAGDVGEKDCLRMASTELLLQVLGITPGSVSPFCLLNDRESHMVNVVIVDATLTNHPALNVHPLDNTATTTVELPDMMRLLEYCGHDVMLYNFDEKPKVDEAEEEKEDDHPWW